MPNKYKYKNSNVPWIGAIPEHWEIMKGKHIFKIYGNSIDENNIYTNFKDKSKLIYYYKVDDMNYDKNSLIMSSKIEPKYTDVIVPAIPKYSILIPKRGAAIATNKVKISLNKCYIDSNIMALYTNFNSKFYSYFLYARGLWDIADVSSVPQINNKHINFLEFVLPTINEQDKIADYLDKKTSKIDTTIAKNKELIQLLEEKRTALINQVVTKGLNPEVPMKDSGIEWIGEIPEHWKTNKIKNMSYVKGRIGWHGLTSEEYSDEGAYLVTGTDFEEGTVDWNHCNHISYERYKQDPNIHLKEGDLLITKDGTIGKLALIKNIPDKATLNSGIFLVRPLKDNYTNEYLYWILSSDIFTRFFDYIKTGATIAHLYQETFERFFFPYMDINEQNKIVDFLNIHISKINFTIKKVEENINLLEEYKTSLIHHVVTGKIDVRGEEI